nr:S-locus-specific glycoprotein S13-like [Arachis hypogaea]
MENFIIVIPMICFYLIFPISKTIAETDTITHFQSLSKSQTLVSKNGEFELGFFTLDNSTNHYYLGIWYKKIPGQTIVWVANREKPATNPNFVLLIINNTTMNSLLLSHNNNNVLWSVSVPRKLKNPVLQLLDSGNLVLREQNNDDENEEKNYVWQSFDYPGDTLLPGMKLGKDLRTGFVRRLTAWKNKKDPSPGTFNWEMDVTKWPEPMQRIGSMKQFSSGPWIGVDYGSKITREGERFFKYVYFSNEDEVYFAFQLDNNSVPMRMALDQATYRRLYLVWIDSDQQWLLYNLLPRVFCERYGVCGPNSNCDWNKSACDCLRGFRPNRAGSCLRDKPLNCKTDGFVKYVKMKVPDTSNCLYLNQSTNLVECRDKCLRNCSCVAYANSDIRGEGKGCALWFGDLNDLRTLPDAGQDLYIRVPASEIGM